MCNCILHCSYNQVIYNIFVQKHFTLTHVQCL